MRGVDGDAVDVAVDDVENDAARWLRVESGGRPEGAVLQPAIGLPGTNVGRVIGPNQQSQHTPKWRRMVERKSVMMKRANKIR
jgi:hypothetical protein